MNEHRDRLRDAYDFDAERRDTNVFDGWRAEIVDDFLSRDLASRDRAPSTVVVHRWAAGLIKSHVGKKPAATLTVRQVDERRCAKHVGWCTALGSG